MASLGTLELALHQPQRLPRGEDSLSRLMLVSVSFCRIAPSCHLPRCQTWLQRRESAGVSMGAGERIRADNGPKVVRPWNQEPVGVRCGGLVKDGGT